jgi:peptidoglycan/xylan/chitin deacetylase (PgdA/CDA1 family)
MNTIRVAIRFDDPSETSQHDIEDAVIDSLARHGLSATFAVIPFRRIGHRLQALSAARAARMMVAQRAGVIEVAQHGYSHEDWTSTTLGIPSEFLGKSVTEQLSDIQVGLNHLRTLFNGGISGFVPPWNKYDVATADAILAAGFRYVSAEWRTRHERQALLCIPRTCQMTELKGQIHAARRLGKLDLVIVAVMHHYDFFESGEANAKLGLAQFDKLMTWLVAQADVQVQTLGQLAQDSADDIRRAMRLQRLKQHLPWRVRVRLPGYCLVTAPWWRVMNHVIHNPA